MEIGRETRNGIQILTVSGRLDSNTSEKFENELYTAVNNGTTHLIVDMEALDYISSAGLRVILKATKDLKQKQGGIVLCSLQDYVREVFEIAGFDSYLNIESTREKALAAL
ncbi:MAG: STAS domain-containing protein [Pseudomonadota bacterium]